MTRVLAFDGSILGSGPITGVAGSFLTTLAAYAQQSPDDCVLLLHRDVRRPDIPNVRVSPCLRRGRLGRLGSLRGACFALRADLLHSPVTAIPGRVPCPTIATVHDVPWLYPELRKESGSRWPRRFALRLAARGATAVIVPSRATQHDLHRAVKIDAAKVHVIPHGVAPPDQPAPEPDLTGPFLVLGDDRPRKNLDRVRRAHALAQAEDPTLPGLRCVGPGHGGANPGPGGADPGHSGADSGLGWITEEEKWQILRRSRALLHLSLLEGFGLPVLEAFAHGVPVVCSDTTSLPEVAGDAALTADPRDETEIMRALIRIHRDEDLRTQLRSRGLRRASECTPAASATGWLRVHEALS